MNIRYIVLTIIALIAINSGCRKKRDHSAEATISKRDFIEILVDMQIKDGTKQYIRSENYVYTQPDSSGAYDDILAKHGYTALQLDSTLKYYSGEPEQLNKIYDEVIKRLTKMQAAYDKEIKKSEEAIQDSLDI
jgi:hypothetical protein